MVKVDLWLLVDDQEFYDYLEFDHSPSFPEVGTAVWEKYNTIKAYYSEWEDQSTGQADIFFIEDNPDYMAEFKTKLDNFLS